LHRHPRRAQKIRDYTAHFVGPPTVQFRFELQDLVLECKFTPFKLLIQGDGTIGFADGKSILEMSRYLLEPVLFPKLLTPTVKASAAVEPLDRFRHPQLLPGRDELLYDLRTRQSLPVHSGSFVGFPVRLLHAVVAQPHTSHV